MTKLCKIQFWNKLPSDFHTNNVISDRSVHAPVKMASKTVMRLVSQNYYQLDHWIMQFVSFQLLYKYGKRTRHLGAFLFLL